MQTNTKRWFYLGVFCIVNLFAGSYYAWSVFAGPLSERLTQLTGAVVSAADLGVVFATASAVNPLAMVLGGWVNDRYGPRAIVAVGGLMIGSGLVLSSVVESVWGLVLVYGIVFGFGVGVTYTSTIGSALKYFPDRRGLAGGIATMSYGLCSIVLPPVAGALISEYGIVHALQVIGTTVGVIIATGGLLSRRCSDNGTLLAKASQSFREQGPNRPSRRAREMLVTPVFWAMVLFFVAASTGAMMLVSAAAPIAEQQIGADPAMAAWVVSCIALMNAVGRFAAGLVSDWLGRLQTLFLCLACEIVGLICLVLCGTGDAALFFTGASLVGFCYGGFVGIYPSFTVDRFGAKYNSVNYGFMAAGFSLGGIIGPVLLRVLAHDGNYTPAYSAALAVAVLGMVFGCLCRRLGKSDDVRFLLKASCEPDRFSQPVNRSSVP